MTTKEESEKGEVEGAEIVDVEYTGDYYHPFRYELSNGETIIGVTQ